MVLKRRPVAAFEETQAETAVAEKPVEQAQATQQKEPEAAATVASAPVMATPGTALATPVGGALAKPRVPAAEVNTITNLKNAIEVGWGTLPAAMASNGNIMIKEGEVVLGSQVMLNLMSYQDQYVCAPNSKGAPAETLKFGNNPDTASDGTDMKLHLAMLKETYPSAKMTHRYIVVGALEATEKNEQWVGKLVQLDLAPMSKLKFDQYRVQTMYDIERGKLTGEQAKLVVITAKISKNKGGDIFTLVEFETAKE